MQSDYNAFCVERNDVRARFVARSYHTTVCSQPCFARNTNGVLMQNLRPESERIFSSGKEEDAGILSYFKDDDTDGGEIRPPRAHCNLIALTNPFKPRFAVLIISPKNNNYHRQNMLLISCFPAFVLTN